MKILALSPLYPWPPEDGDRIRAYNFFKRIALKHEVHLLCFADTAETGGAGFFESEFFVELSGVAKTANVVKGIFSGEALNIAAYASDEMMSAAKEAYGRLKPDLVYCYRLRMAPYAEALPAPRVIDIVDSLALYNGRRAYYERNPVRRAYIGLDLPRILKREKGLGENFSRVFINSGDDASYLGIKNISVAANGATKPCPAKGKRETGPTAGFLGNMEYAPNLDAALFFVKKIWKNIGDSDKNIKMVFAGDSKGLLKKWRKMPGLTVKGRLPDIYGELSGWDVSVVPVRYGAGRQNKILDSWAAGVPVVSTSFAAKGVYGIGGKNLLIEDEPVSFAKAVIRVVQDRALAARLVAGGRETLKKHFDWEKNMKKVLREIAECVK